MPYISQQDLENALGASLVTAIFDDDNDGAPETAAITACLAYGDAECNSFLRGVYGASVPFTSPPDEVKFAALDFCCAYAARRRPELAHTLGANPFKDFYDAAVAKMKRYASVQQRLPATAGTPAGLGGVARPSPACGVSGEERPRVFDDMGEFNR